MQGDLTSLSNVKAWLGINSGSTANDPLLGSLITAASKFIMNRINRDSLAKRSVVNTVDGNGHNFMVLREWPVLSVDQVEWAGTTITLQAGFNPQSNGILLEEPQTSAGQQRLTLIGYCFPRGRSNVRVTYTAGYYVPAEAAVIPTVGPFSVVPNEMWIEDGGVTYMGGAALTPVASNPAQGQYAISGGIYLFNSADAGQAIVLAYSYVPADLEQATTELVGERYKAKDRIGVTGQTLAGKESITFFSTKDLTSWVNSSLQPYVRVTPA